MKTFFSFFLMIGFVCTLSAQQKVVSVIDQMQIKLQRNKPAIPLALPEGTVAYFYSVTVLPKKEKFATSKSLFEQVQLLQDDYGFAQIANHIEVQQSSKTANVIFVEGKESADAIRAFGHKSHFDYQLNRSSHAAYVTEGPMEDIYIAIENRDFGKRFNIMIEVVAVVL